MHELIAEEWNRETIDVYEWQRKWETAFSVGFERADNDIMTETIAPDMVGSTAVVAVVSGCQIMISNCGDSRAVLCRGTQTIPLTVDQKVRTQYSLNPLFLFISKLNYTFIKVNSIMLYTKFELFLCQ